MKNKELYKQLAILIDEYKNIQEEALAKVTKFADENGLIIQLTDSNYRSTYYVPQVSGFDQIQYEDTDQQEQFEYFQTVNGSDDFDRYVSGKWLTSSHFC